MTGDWACHPTSITVNSKVVPYHLIKSLQLIWRSGTRRWNLRILYPQVSPSDLTRIYKICICSSERTVYALTIWLFWCLFPELRSNEGNKHQNNTRVSAKTVRHESTYIILFLIWHNEYIDDDKNDDLHTSSPCFTRRVYFLLMTSQSIADDVIMNRQLWRDNMKLISNSWPVVSL